jgi:hypothetical protein
MFKILGRDTFCQGARSNNSNTHPNSSRRSRVLAMKSSSSSSPHNLVETNAEVNRHLRHGRFRPGQAHRGHAIDRLRQPAFGHDQSERLRFDLPQRRGSVRSCRYVKSLSEGLTGTWIEQEHARASHAPRDRGGRRSLPLLLTRIFPIPQPAARGNRILAASSDPD